MAHETVASRAEGLGTMSPFKGMDLRKAYGCQASGQRPRRIIQISTEFRVHVKIVAHPESGIDELDLDDEDEQTQDEEFDLPTISLSIVEVEHLRQDIDEELPYPSDTKSPEGVEEGGQTDFREKERQTEVVEGEDEPVMVLAILEPDDIHPKREDQIVSVALTGRSGS